MRLIKLKEVMNRTAMAKSTIYKYMDEGTFPKSVKLGARSVAWVECQRQLKIDPLIGVIAEVKLTHPPS